MCVEMALSSILAESLFSAVNSKLTSTPLAPKVDRKRSRKNSAHTCVHVILVDIS